MKSSTKKAASPLNLRCSDGKRSKRRPLKTKKCRGRGSASDEANRNKVTGELTGGKEEKTTIGRVASKGTSGEPGAARYEACPNKTSAGGQSVIKASRARNRITQRQVYAGLKTEERDLQAAAHHGDDAKQNRRRL